MINVSVNGNGHRFPRGITAWQVLKQLGGRLAGEAVAVKIDTQLIDLSTPLGEDCQLEAVTFSAPEGAEVYRHTSSHILAQAVKRLFPGVKLGIGPAIAGGFYYDFDLDKSLTPEDLEKIEQEMRRIIKENLPLERHEVSREEAAALFRERGEGYKLELLEDLDDDAVISYYRQGDFVDLCAGPHLPSTGAVKAVKLLNVAGAYWRGSEQRPMLQRIYGTSFPRQKLLQEHLERLEEARKRDHRRLGRELDLFSFHEEGPGFAFFHPKGMALRRELEKFWHEEHRLAGYREILTPIILDRRLWEQSGHWDHYKENIYFTQIDERDFAVKPMNCPGAMLVYKTELHSYRDFPLRLAELGTVHRHELSGTLHGLMRVRSFTQDDAHIFMLPEQVEGELERVIDLVDRFYRAFGFNYHVELSTRPEKYMGSLELWEQATAALQTVLQKKGVDYKINEGDGAFYGPKIDFHLQDSIGRTWQCGTIQLDFQMPEKLDLSYVGEDGQKHRPAMIHRVVYGALERFIALLIEHYAGAFPVWLAPVQAIVLPLSEKQLDYSRRIYGQLFQRGFRVEINERSEKLGYKIREAQLQKIPYMLVVGAQEEESQTVSLRHRQQGDLGGCSLEQFIERLQQEIAAKKIDV